MVSSETQITNLLYRYAEYIDSGDFAGAASLFEHARDITRLCKPCYFSPRVEAERLRSARALQQMLVVLDGPAAGQPAETPG